MGTVILLYLLALGARAFLLVLFPDPAYPDSFYYVNVARAIAEGRGLNVDFLWIFAEVGGRIPADPVLPIPANAHWMPLASLVQVPFIALLGPTALASALPFALVGSLAAPLAWAVAREAGARPIVAVGAGVLTAIPALSLVFMTQPDNFSLFQPLVLGALWLGARGLRGDGRAFALAGLLVGLATLSRNDGVLVGAALALAFAWSRWRAWRARGGTIPTIRPIPLWAAAACFGLFLLAVGPWWLRQLETFGQLSPSTASGKVLFIRTIDEWNSITTPATLDHLLGQGAGPLLASRVSGLVSAITIFSVLVGGVILAPFMVIGGWLRRRSTDFGPFFLYAGLLFAFSAIVSAVHVPGGTFIHSAVALAPHAYILALEGIVAAVAWVAARRSAWNAGQATRVFAGSAVAYAVVVAFGGALVTQAGWSELREQRQAVARALDEGAVPTTDRIMSIDAAGYRYHTGRGGVVLVNDPLDTIEAVARAYGVRWLVVERGDAVRAVAPVLAGERPAWIGPPLWHRQVSAPGDGAAATTVAVYPVCVSTGDARCGTSAEARP